MTGPDSAKNNDLQTAMSLMHGLKECCEKAIDFFSKEDWIETEKQHTSYPSV